MNRFEEHLQYINGKISIKDEDRQPYTHIFDTTRNWLIQSMCQIDPVFKKLYSGTCLFGSYVNRVRIIKPNEFDVFIVLKFPYKIDTCLDYKNPGFVNLDLKATLTSLARDPNYKDVYAKFHDLANEEFKLNNNSFQLWIQNIINKVIYPGCQAPIGYEIKYKKHNVAHYIHVREIGSDRTISIDFVPAFRLNREEWMQPFYYKYIDTLLAIPKLLDVSNNTNLTFQLVNPEAERDILWNKQNLKVVYRLLKSLRNKFGLHRIKSYFLTAIFLWEVEKPKYGYWNQPVGKILIDMLAILSEYFHKGHLPYYWAKNCNLLSILKREDILLYAATIDDIRRKLENCRRQQHVLILQTVASYFEIQSD